MVLPSSLAVSWALAADLFLATTHANSLTQVTAAIQIHHYLHGAVFRTHQFNP